LKRTWKEALATYVSARKEGRGKGRFVAKGKKEGSERRAAMQQAIVHV
jgi:hypothetical protein